MPISKLIEKLEAIKKEYGDLEVYIWDTYDGGRKVIENIDCDDEGDDYKVVDIVMED